MIDDNPEGADPGHDPLSGKDPHPREQIDLWPLHDARQELLEEIVSQSAESSTRTRMVLSVVGIAAVLALVVGGAWAVTSDGSGDGKDDDQVAAATSATPTSDPATDTASDPAQPTTEATATETAEPTQEPRQRDGLRRKGVKIGSVRTLRECRVELDRATDRKGQLRRLDRVIKRGKHQWRLYIVRNGRRTVAVDGDCNWIRVVPDRPRQRH